MMKTLGTKCASVSALLAGMALLAVLTLPAREQAGLLSDRSKTYPAGGPKRERPIHVDVNVVLVNVTVMDASHHPVTGLEKEHFRVSENRLEQKILHFSKEDIPLSVGLVVDTSGSMSNKLDRARMAVHQFLNTANRQDEFFLVTFADQPRLACDFTDSIEEIESKLAPTEARGHTALLDAVYLALHQMRHARYPRKALLVLSDGGDNHSRYAASEIFSLVKEADVQIYAIGIFDARGSRPTLEERSGPQLLGDLAGLTGGRQLPVNNLKELPELAERIGIELRSQYLLGYIPNDAAKDGKWRKIKVSLTPPVGLRARHVYAKSGYYAPSQ